MNKPVLNLGREFPQPDSVLSYGPLGRFGHPGLIISRLERYFYHFACERRLPNKLLDIFDKARDNDAYKALRRQLPFRKDIEALQSKDFTKFTFVGVSGGSYDPQTIPQNPIICFSGDGRNKSVEEYKHIRISQAKNIRATLKAALQKTESVCAQQEIKSALSRVFSFGYRQPNIHPEITTNALDLSALKLIDDPHYCGPQAENFVKEFFRPRIFSDVEKGFQLDAKTLKYNMRMTLSGSSAGGAFIRQVMNGLKKELAQAGYQPNVIDDAMSNIYIHNVSADQPLTNPNNTAEFSYLDYRDSILLAKFGRAEFRPSEAVVKEGKSLNNGSNSLLHWIHVEDEFFAQAKKQYGYTPSSIAHQAPAVFNILPQPAINALLCSVLESNTVPDINKMIQFDVDDYKRKTECVVHNQPTGIFEEDVYAALLEDQNVFKSFQKFLQEKIDFKFFKNFIAEIIQSKYINDEGQSVFSNQVAKSYAGKFVRKLEDGELKFSEENIAKLADITQQGCQTNANYSPRL